MKEGTVYNGPDWLENGFLVSCKRVAMDVCNCALNSGVALAPECHNDERLGQPKWSSDRFTGAGLGAASSWGAGSRADEDGCEIVDGSMAVIQLGFWKWEGILRNGKLNTVHVSEPYFSARSSKRASWIPYQNALIRSIRLVMPIWVTCLALSVFHRRYFMDGLDKGSKRRNVAEAPQGHLIMTYLDRYYWLLDAVQDFQDGPDPSLPGTTAWWIPAESFADISRIYFKNHMNPGQEQYYFKRHTSWGA